MRKPKPGKLQPMDYPKTPIPAVVKLPIALVVVTAVAVVASRFLGA
jgi:hypothetical protein